MDVSSSKRKKVAIVIGAAIIILLIIAGAWQAYKKWGPKKPIPVGTFAPSSFEKSSRAFLSKDELDLLKTQSAGEIEANFKVERDACKSGFSGLQQRDPQDIMKLVGALYRIDPFEVDNYLTCSAVKDNKAEYCDQIPDQAIKSHCQNRAKLFTEALFPAMRAGTCSAKNIEACQASGQDDCTNLCAALTTSGAKDSSFNFPNGSLAKSIANAVTSKKFSACDDQMNKTKPSPEPGINVDQWQECQQWSHFVRAVREKNSAILEEISGRDNYPIFKQFIDSNFDCRKILDIGEVKCDAFFNKDRLNLLLSKAGS